MRVSSAVTAVRDFGWRARSAGPYAKNLVANPSAEDLYGSGTLTGWNAGSGATWASDDPVNAASGTVFAGVRSLQLATAGATGDWRCDYFPVTESVDYLVQGMFIGTAIINCFLTIRWFRCGRDGVYI